MGGQKVVTSPYRPPFEYAFEPLCHPLIAVKDGRGVLLGDLLCTKGIMGTPQHHAVELALGQVRGEKKVLPFRIISLDCRGKMHTGADGKIAVGEAM